MSAGTYGLLAWLLAWKAVAPRASGHGSILRVAAAQTYVAGGEAQLVCL